VRDHIDEKDYNRLAELESKHWENIQFNGENILKDQKVLLQWANHPVVKIYTDICQTGEPGKDWLHFLLNNFKRFRYGCSIGCGSGWAEQILIDNGVIEKMDGYDISEGAVAEARKTNRYPQRLYFNVIDCNKIELEAGKYDFILFHHSFHHLMELEHIVDTIEAALSDDGIIVLVDYIGETRGRWEAEKIDICKFLLELMPEGVVREISIFDQDFFRENPFEMIRSSDILPLMNARFRPIWQRNMAGVLYPLNNTIVSAIQDKKYNRFIVLACIIDALCKGFIKPCFTFSIYTLKNNSATINADEIYTERILDFLIRLLA
jgi:SAM-dependent methyltransferase